MGGQVARSERDSEGEIAGSRPAQASELPGKSEQEVRRLRGVVEKCIAITQNSDGEVSAQAPYGRSGTKA